MSESKDSETLAEQGKHMAHNMAEVFDISGQIWQTFLAGQLQEGASRHPDPLNTWPTFFELYRTMWDNPKQVADKTIEFWASQQQLWQNSMLKWLGAKEAADDLDLPHMLKADKRFSHKEWSENAIFDYLKQSYLLTSGWLQDTVNSVGEMDPKERRKAAFYTRYFVEAMNPANFFALNPEVLETTANEKGENLVRGLKMMLADLERGKGKLLIRQTDMDAFEVGKNTAVSPGAVVFENDLIQLIQYAPATEKVYAKPLLIIPPWINKFYILDLNPEEEHGQVAGRAGPHRLRRLLGQPRPAARAEDLGGLHVRGRADRHREGARGDRGEEPAPRLLLRRRHHGRDPDGLARQDRRQARRLAPPSSPRSSTSRTPASCRSSSTSTSSRWSARTWTRATCRPTGWPTPSTCSGRTT